MDTCLSSFQLCEEVGVTFRVVDYWDHHNVLRPSIAQAKGNGSRRRYSDRDLRIARVLNVLRLMGAGVDVLRSVAVALQVKHLDEGGCLLVSPMGDCVEDRAAAEARAWACWWTVNLEAAESVHAANEAHRRLPAPESRHG